MFNDCGECNACCTGVLIGNVYGKQMGASQKCFYLVEEKCTIYNCRPSMCRNYFCAWTQNIIPGLKRPNESGILVSVENEPSGKQYLKTMIFRKDVEESQIELINQWASEQNTYNIMVKNEN